MRVNGKDCQFGDAKRKTIDDSSEASCLIGGQDNGVLVATITLGGAHKARGSLIDRRWWANLADLN